MPRKISLREFQESLTARLMNAARGQETAGMLAIQAGRENWLINLADAGEINPVSTLTTVPLTQPWFAGIANIRGTLYAVTDFSAFLGGEPTPLNASARLLLVGSAHGTNAVLLVNRTLGLKNRATFTPADPDPDMPDWQVGCVFCDQEMRWRVLDVRSLLADPRFIHVES